MPNGFGDAFAGTLPHTPNSRVALVSEMGSVPASEGIVGGAA